MFCLFYQAHHLCDGFFFKQSNNHITVVRIIYINNIYCDLDRFDFI